MKADPSLDYTFNHYFQTYVGLPVYFVNPSSTTSTATTTSTSTGFMDGFGNAYVGIRIGADNPTVNYASNLVFTAPTGNNPRSAVDFQIGYTRSVNYSLDTLFFGVGFRFGK